MQTVKNIELIKWTYLYVNFYFLGKLSYFDFRKLGSFWQARESLICQVVFGRLGSFWVGRIGKDLSSGIVNACRLNLDIKGLKWRACENWKENIMIRKLWITRFCKIEIKKSIQDLLGGEKFSKIIRIKKSSTQDAPDVI